MKKPAIALLITVLFVMAITVSIGIGLKHVNIASSEIQKENFMLQTRLALVDVLKILRDSEQLDYIVKNKSPSALFLFISQSSFVPFESAGVRMLLQIKSARSKYNINDIIHDTNKTKTQNNIQNMKQFLSNNEINPDFTEMMLDVMGGVKEDLIYNSDIFYDKPSLFRDNIVSKEHFNEIKDYFELSFHENSLNRVDFDNLFSFSKDKNRKIDLNYATSEVWQMILGVDKIRADELALAGGSYIKEEDIPLESDEIDMLKMYQYGLYEPYIDVSIEIVKDNNSAKIQFEYDLVEKKGKNFSYVI